MKNDIMAIRQTVNDMLGTFQDMQCAFSLDDSEHETWKDGSRLHEEHVFQFIGCELILRPDGSYSLNDTTGG